MTCASGVGTHVDMTVTILATVCIKGLTDIFRAYRRSFRWLRAQDRHDLNLEAICGRDRYILSFRMMVMNHDA